MIGFEWIKVWGPEAQKAFAARRAAGLPSLCIATRTADGAWCGLPDAHAGRCEPRFEEPAVEPRDGAGRALVALRDLSPGTVFEAQSGWRGVKTAEEWAPDMWTCVVLGDGTHTRESGETMVVEIPLP